MVPLGEVATIERSGVDPTVLDRDTPYLGLEHIASGGPIREYSSIGRAELTSTKFRFDERQVLFGKLRPNLGKIARPDRAGVCSTDILPITPSTRLDRGYLAHYLSQPSMVAFAASRTSGANLPRLSPGVLATFEVPLPEIGEQRRIAAILDKADAIRAKRRQVLAHLDALTQSIFHNMFSQTPASVTVADVALDTRTGPFGSQLLHSEFVGEGIAVLGLDNVVDNEFRHGGGRFITSSKYEKLKRYTVIPGDVLISIMGTVGRCVVVPSGIPTAINTKHICAVTPNPELVLSQFLRASFLWHPTARAHLRRQTKGSIMDGLNLGIIRSMPIPLPSLGEQAIFAARVDSVRDAASGVLQAIGLAEQLFASLQSRAFKGEL